MMWKLETAATAPEHQLDQVAASFTASRNRLRPRNTGGQAFSTNWPAAAAFDAGPIRLHRQPGHRIGGDLA